MRVADLASDARRSRLKAGGLLVGIGPFTVRVRSALRGFPEAFARLYADFPLAPEGAFVDFTVALRRPGGLRRWWRPQVRFYLDEHPPFKPLPAAQAQPFFEWGLNWCIASHVHDYLTVHGAVVEKGGRAAILPGPPGSGKSTLCTALLARGWRLLSDELALIRLDTGALAPFPRPVGLKNASIDRARRLLPAAVIDGIATDTRKGTVALLKPPRESVERAAEVAEPAWIVLPRYRADVDMHVAELSTGEAFVSLVENAFNYPVLGVRGFHAAADAAERCAGFAVEYSDAATAAARLDALVDGEPSRLTSVTA